MHTSIKAGLLAASAAFGLAVAAPANAQDIEGTGLSVSGNVALTSDYRFRGVSLSDGNVAVQGGIDIGHESGFYIGTWASSLASVDDTGPFDDGTGSVVSSPIGNYGAIELDVYAGWSGEVASGVTFDIGLLYYIYPDALNTFTVEGPVGTSGLPTIASLDDFDTDYFEAYTSLGFSFGPVDTTVGAAYAWDQDSLGNEDNLYLYLDLSAGIPDTPITLNGHVGYTDGVLAPDVLADVAAVPDDNGFDWGIGADWAITDNLTASVMYVGTEGADVEDFTDDSVFFTLAFSM